MFTRRSDGMVREATRHMLKKSTQKLSIRTETIRKLADADLTRVNGGAQTDVYCSAHCTVVCYPSQNCSLHYTGCCSV